MYKRQDAGSLRYTMTGWAFRKKMQKLYLFDGQSFREQKQVCMKTKFLGVLVILISFIIVPVFSSTYYTDEEIEFLGEDCFVESIADEL